MTGGRDASGMKYMVVYAALRDDICRGVLTAGQRLPSEEALCVRFNMSRITVRSALSKLATEGLIEKGQGRAAVVLGQKRSFRRPKNKRIAILTFDSKNHVFDGIINGMRSALDKSGYSYSVKRFTPTTMEKRIYLKEALQEDHDGLIIEGQNTALPCPNLDLYEEIRRRGIPMVFTNGYHEQVPCSKVRVNDSDTTEALVDHLYALGHRNIGGIFHCTQWQALRRYQGYLNGIRKHGLTYDDNCVIFIPLSEMEMLFDTQFIHLKKKLLKCTAFVCYNDETASFLEATFRRAGISVPGDISITGFDGVMPTSTLGSALTTARYPCREVGEAAVESLLYMLEAGEPAEDKVLPTQIRIGNTTKRII